MPFKRSFFLQTANVLGMFVTLLNVLWQWHIIWSKLYILPVFKAAITNKYKSVIALHLNYSIITSLHGLLWLNALIFTWVNQSSTGSIVCVQLSELKESWHRWSMTIMRIWRTAGLAVVTDAITCDRCQTLWPHLSVRETHITSHMHTRYNTCWHWTPLGL